jgi:hypothetical protein
VSEVCVFVLVGLVWLASLVAVAYYAALSVLDIITVGKLRTGVRLDVAVAEVQEDAQAGIDTLRSRRYGAVAWRLVERVREANRG